MGRGRMSLGELVLLVLAGVGVAIGSVVLGGLVVLVCGWALVSLELWLSGRRRP